MNSKSNSLEEKVKLPPTETISRCYQPQQSNRKVIRILTVAVYVLCVSLAAIMLSLYYIFIWDPTIRPFVTKGNNCDKIVIPEKIAIRLLNSSEVTAEQFYKHILEQYRILNQLQQQRQQFLQKQHIQLQQLAAANRFQEIFATATIIQSNSNDLIKKPITPTNGTFLLEPARPVTADLDVAPIVPILDTSPAHIPKRKQHRKHYNHHRRTQKSHKKITGTGIGMGMGMGVVGAATATVYTDTASSSSSSSQTGATSLLSNNSSTAGYFVALPSATAAIAGNNNNKNIISLQEQLRPESEIELESHFIQKTPLNPPTAIVQEPVVYTSMPIPLILNSSEDKRPAHHGHAHAHAHGERRGGGGGAGAQARKRTTSATVSGYDAQTYLNPFLTGELIFEK